MHSEENNPDNNTSYEKEYSLYTDRPQLEALSYDLFFNDGPFAIIILDKSFQINKVNKRVEDFFKQDSSDVLGRNIFTFLHAEDALKLKITFEIRSIDESPLLVKLGFIQKNGKIIPVDTFVKKFNNSLGEASYSLLMFDKEFCPDSNWLDSNHQVFKVIIDTQENERQRIGQQLHDSVAQLLYGIRLNLQNLLNKNEGFQDEILPLKHLLNEAIHQTRNISVDLVPSVLQDFGLKTAIETMALRFTMEDFKISCVIPDNIDSIDRDMQLVAYRIIQELLNNAMKYSNANEVKVSVIKNKDSLSIQVADNGQGFSEKPEESMEKGTGLRTIKNMTELYKGDLKISSSKLGSSIKIELQNL